MKKVKPLRKIPVFSCNRYIAILAAFFILNASHNVFSQEKRFTLLHTSDEHSNLLPLPLVDYNPGESNPSIGGFARLSTLVKQVRASKPNEPVLLLSSGDFIGGSPFAWLILEGYSPELEIMNKIGYAATTIGNHEFDYGPDILADYLLRLGYPQFHDELPIIISNLSIPYNHKLNSTALPENKIFILENGLKVGVFGLLGNEAYSLAPAAEPVKINDPLESAQKQVQRLKEAGADVIILLSHSGIAEDRLFAEKVEGIDIILGGHDHIQKDTPENINNTIILHSSNYLKKLGNLELAFNESTKKLSLINDENNSPYLYDLNSSIAEDPEISDLVALYGMKLNDFLVQFTDSLITGFDSTVMHSDISLVKHLELEETTVGNFITDAMRLMAQEITGDRVDIAFQANGVIRGDIIPGSMDWSKGKVSFLDLVTIAGLGTGPDKRPGYPMVSFYLTAEEVHSVLEIAALLSQLMGDTYFLQFSGLRYTYDPGKAIWLRIPVMNTPVPAYRSVRSVEIFTGEGIQTNGDFVALDKKSDRLYHLVSDHYLTSFLPMIGEILPKLKLVLKDKNGNPLEVDNTIIMNHGHEFKVWEAVARYAVSFDKNAEGISVLPMAYKSTQDRIVVTAGTPLYIWSYIILVLILVGMVLLIRWIIRKVRRRKKS